MNSPGTRSRLTIRDVASSAGVSTATVSRVINGLGGVSDRARLRVLTAVEVLNYSPNAIAAQLRRRGSDQPENPLPTRPEPADGENAPALQALEDENKQLKRLLRDLIMRTSGRRKPAKEAR